jgi:proteasome lid subunit RPN8/RPN11
MTGSNTPPPSAPPPGNGGGSRPSELHIHLQRVLPVAQSLLWHPTSPAVGVRRQPSGVYPVFFDQKAIAAVQVHYETAGRQGMMGFLVGDLFECPTSHVRYVVVDSTIRLNQAVYGDKTLVIVSRLWERIQDELRKTEGHLIGWYHSHPPIGVELAPGDVETHLQYFKRPWHVALVLGTEHEGPVAGLFRPRPGETSVSMPFYELIESDEGFAGGKKRSILPWINLLTDDPAVVYAEAHGDGAPPSAAAPVAAGPTLQVVRPPAIKSGPVRAVTPAPPPGRTPTPPPAPATAPRPGLGARPTPRPGGGAPVAPASGEVPAAAAPPARPAPPAPPAPQARSFTPARPAAAGGQPPAAGTGPGGRRDTQMKPPPNALSDLPLLAAGGYDIGESDARESNPDVVTPRSRETAPVAAPARSRTHAPQPSRAFAPALAPRKSDGHPGLVAFLILLLLGGGGYAGWYFLLRQPAETAASAGTSTVATTPAPPAAAPAPASTPPGPPALDSALLRFERMSDSVAVVVGAYETSMRQFDARRVNCDGLSRALVAVEDVWTDYNVGKRRAGSLDATHASRDQSLYAAVDSVERAFDRSGCQRP